MRCGTTLTRESSGLVVECLSRDRGVAGLSLTDLTVLCLSAVAGLSLTDLTVCVPQQDPLNLAECWFGPERPVPT